MRDIHAKFGIANPPHSPDTGQKWDRCISYFWFSVQSPTPIKVNCHNCRTSVDNDMKFGAVTNLNKRKKTTSKNLDHEFTSGNCDVVVIFPVVIFPIYGQFGAMRNPDSGYIVCKTYLFINSNLLSCKNWKQN